MGNEEHKYDTVAYPNPFNYMMLATGTVHNNHWVGLCDGCCNAYIPYMVNCGYVCILKSIEMHMHSYEQLVFVKLYCLQCVWYVNKQSKLYVKDVI